MLVEPLGPDMASAPRLFAWQKRDEEVRRSARMEIANLERRRQLASRSINFCTDAALLVSIVIATLFLEESFRTDLKWLGGCSSWE
jgi:hypothetical protein